MIPVQRPSAVPSVLANEGKRETAHNIAKVRAKRADYRSGAKTLEFEREIYGHPTVKDELIDAQHAKCAFCESSFRAVTFGDVEHFRPKGGFRQRRSGALRRPGYSAMVRAYLVARGFPLS